MVKRPADRPFLVALAVGFPALFVAWNSVIRFAPSTFPQLNQAEENRARVVKYVLAPAKPLVLAGTSLMYRIRPAFFDIGTATSRWQAEARSSGC